MKMLKREVFKNIYKAKKIYLTAHSNIDLDAYASMVGFSLIAKKFRKEVYIVIDDKKIEKATLQAMELTSKNVNIITSEKAKETKDKKSLLVILDVNKPILTTNEELVSLFDKVMVIDHHNITNETLKTDNLFVYKKASSTCEIVAELLSNFKVKIPKDIATIMLGGIALDTNNFTYKMTEKSFYYCYYLASKGADITKAQLLLKQDLKEYINRSKIIANTKVDGEIAITTGQRFKTYSPQDLAKIADTLLSFKGIKNAFAIGKLDKNKTGVSARSLNKVNAGKLMEKLGGGGNNNEAAAIIENKTIKEIEKEILSALK